ncbi:hypothetical protein [Luteibacter sp.]|uniref:hypothetical protein n=1 Tax=Luteibacter sp. TaxID=1886636 RepID=UPI003F8026A5
MVALYFAVNDPLIDSADSDGAIWALLPAKYNYEVPRFRPRVEIDIPCFGVDPMLDDYGPIKMSQEGMSELYPIAAIAHRRNERIMAQLGVFTIMHRDMTAIDDIPDAQPHLARIRIPAAAKSRLRAELSYLRINRMMLFPELASVAELTKEILA